MIFRFCVIAGLFGVFGVFFVVNIKVQFYIFIYYTTNLLSINTHIIYWGILNVNCGKRNHHSGHRARCTEAEDPVKEGRQKQLFPDRGSPDGGPSPAVCCYQSSQSCCTVAGV